MSAVLEKSSAVTDHPKPVQRMTLSDVEEFAPWIAEKMQRRTGLATPEAVKTWLRGAVTHNDTFFVRSGGAVAMARLVREPLRAAKAEEVFCFCRPDCENDAADLYIAMATWANNCDCMRLEVEIWSDVSRQMIEKRLGKLRNRPGGMLLF